MKSEAVSLWEIMTKPQHEIMITVLHQEDEGQSPIFKKMGQYEKGQPIAEKSTLTAPSFLYNNDLL